MKKFLLKYWWPILWMSFVTSMIFFIGPAQERYYLADDLRNYKDNQLPRLLLILGLAVWLIWLIVIFFQTRPLKKIIVPLFMFGLYIAFFLFIFQSIILDISLFLNRQINRGSITKTYIAEFADKTENRKSFILLYNSKKDALYDNAVKDILYTDSLKRGDTVYLKINKGLLGIPFSNNKLRD